MLVFLKVQCVLIWASEPCLLCLIPYYGKIVLMEAVRNSVGFSLLLFFFLFFSLTFNFILFSSIGVKQALLRGFLALFLWLKSTAGNLSALCLAFLWLLLLRWVTGYGWLLYCYSCCKGLKPHLYTKKASSVFEIFSWQEKRGLVLCGCCWTLPKQGYQTPEWLSDCSYEQQCVYLL